MKKYNNKPVCKIKKGKNFTAIQLGNIVSRTLKANGYIKQSREFYNKFLSCRSQEEGWKIIGEYVTIEKI